MRRTGLGILVEGTGWLAFLLAFLVGSLVPALAGLAILGFAAGARRRLSGARLEPARRHPARLEVGATFESTLEVATVPPVPVAVRDEPPDAVATTERRSSPGRGRAREWRRGVPRDPGLARWTTFEADLADPWNLYTTTRRVSLPSEAAVLPESRWITVGRNVGRRRTVETAAPSLRGLEPVPEVERLREYQPGDRVRDIDWARTSRLGSLFTKVRERVSTRPVLILLDATATMRWRRRHAKLTTAARFAAGLVAAAEAAGVVAHLVVLDERGVRHHTNLAGGGTVRDALRQLSELSAPVTVDEVPAVASVERPLDAAEQAFLGALAPFVRGPAPAVPPLDAALAVLTHAATAPALVVAILDAEAAPRLAEVAGKRLAWRSHKTVVVAPATGSHHYRRGEAHGRVLARLVEARANRERVRRTLRGARVPLLSLHPGSEREALEEVAEWAR